MADTVAFPVLSAAELAECSEFGTRCSFAPRDEIFGAGSQSFDCYVIWIGKSKLCYEKLQREQTIRKNVFCC